MCCKLEKYSIGMGDRFGYEIAAQLEVVKKARIVTGAVVSPVWNKSFREHSLTGSTPEQLRQSVYEVIRNNDWGDGYFIDADHININTVDLFLESHNYFTMDVSSYIGVKDKVIDKCREFLKEKFGIFYEINDKIFNNKFDFDNNAIIEKCQRLFTALERARELYEYIFARKGNLVVYELSFDETDRPQDIVEIILILIYMDVYSIGLDTIAPRFIGNFYKGIDYIGDIKKFSESFEDIIKVIKYFNSSSDVLSNLKISIHSGSDKFSLYGIIKNIINKYNVGIHLKTAGTTWLEEIRGMAISGDDGWDLVKEIYNDALLVLDELEEPYRDVLNINRDNLPSKEEFDKWDANTFEKKLAHNLDKSFLNPDLRQLFHISYKIAAIKGDRFYSILKKYHTKINELVIDNLFSKHVALLFGK